MNQNLGYNLNPTPQLTAITNSTNGYVATLAAVATDNGSIASVAWDFGDGNTGTGVTINHTYSVAGTYLIRCRVQDNSGSRNSKWVFITVTGVTTGINKLDDNNISVYPNPTDGKINLDLTEYLKGSINMSIYDIIGNKINENQFQPNAKYEINLLGQPAGLYIIKIQDNNGNTLFKKISLN
jgi:PKD repeat protein